MLRFVADGSRNPAAFQGNGTLAPKIWRSPQINYPLGIGKSGQTLDRGTWSFPPHLPQENNLLTGYMHTCVCVLTVYLFANCAPVDVYIHTISMCVYIYMCM